MRAACPKPRDVLIIAIIIFIFTRTTYYAIKNGQQFYAIKSIRLKRLLRAP